MPIRSVPGLDLPYLLIAFDAQGQERRDDPDGVMAERAVRRVRESPITDVFVFCHGWMGAVPEAIRQYDAWTRAMARHTVDVSRMRAARPGFQPLLVGLHWPSKPFGDRDLRKVHSTTARTEAASDPIDLLAAQTSDTPMARDALRVLVNAARDGAPTFSLSREVRKAYVVLEAEMGLRADGPSGAPGHDREPFDPDRVLRSAEDATLSYGGPISEGLLAPLRVLSFWRMKERARRIGEGRGHALLARLQQAASARGRVVRFHLMGHSFGCIVAAGMVCGPPGGATRLSVDSLCLVQGALSLWSFSERIPGQSERPGYFRRLLDGRVRRAIVTTRSRHDRALGLWYPWAAGAAGQVAFDPPGELPRYGAMGAFGARGPGVIAVDRDMLDAQGAYDFRPGTLTNLDGSRYIRNGGGFAGAHGDIDNAEVAHAVWQAALA